jgi:hypothetical protein
MACVLCACSGGSNSPPPAAPVPNATAAEPELPFVGRIWISTTPGSPRGSIMVFLPDRTLLLDSCFETFRLSKWGMAGEHVRWIEDAIPIEAAVSMDGNALRLRLVGQEREQTYVAASVPYVCPDMPR